MPRSATRPRRVALTRESVVEAAIRIADEEDLTALTIRRLATDLGVPPMTLYGHFANKDEILDAMGDAVMGAFVLPAVPAGAGHREVFLQATEAFLDLLNRHPSVARLLTMRVTDSPGALDGAMEQVLERFLTVGMSQQDAVRAYGTMMMFSLGSVLYRLPRPWGGSAASAQAHREGRTAFYRSLDSQRFTRLHQLAHLLPDLAGPAQAQASLEMIADGLTARGTSARLEAEARPEAAAPGR